MNWLSNEYVSQMIIKVELEAYGNKITEGRKNKPKKKKNKKEKSDFKEKPKSNEVDTNLIEKKPNDLISSNI